VLVSPRFLYRDDVDKAIILLQSTPLLELVLVKVDLQSLKLPSPIFQLMLRKPAFSCCRKPQRGEAVEVSCKASSGHIRRFVG
jgi:hypothetical protein